MLLVRDTPHATRPPESVLRMVSCRVGATHRAHELCVGGLHLPYRRENGFLDRVSGHDTVLLQPAKKDVKAPHATPRNPAILKLIPNSGQTSLAEWEQGPGTAAEQ